MQTPRQLVQTSAMTRMYMMTALVACLSLLQGCTSFPALDRTLTPELEAADYPALLPLGPVLAATQPTTTNPARTTAALDARVSALQSRAERLRGAVLNGAERQRLERGLG